MQNPPERRPGPSGVVFFPRRKRDNESLEIETPFPEIGMALAGCAVQFAPRETKSRTPKHLTLPTHSRLPSTDLMEFIVNLAEYAIAGLLF